MQQVRAFPSFQEISRRDITIEWVDAFSSYVVALRLPLIYGEALRYLMTSGQLKSLSTSTDNELLSMQCWDGEFVQLPGFEPLSDARKKRLDEVCKQHCAEGGEESEALDRAKKVTGLRSQNIWDTSRTKTVVSAKNAVFDPFQDTAFDPFQETPEGYVRWVQVSNQTASLSCLII